MNFFYHLVKRDQHLLVIMNIIWHILDMNENIIVT